MKPGATAKASAPGYPWVKHGKMPHLKT